MRESPKSVVGFVGSRRGEGWIGRPGGDLLSRALRHSTMGAGGFHGRVRDGIGCGPPAMTTRSSNPPLVPGRWRGAAARRCPRIIGWIMVLVRLCERAVSDVCGVGCHGGSRPGDLGMISVHGVGHRAVRAIRTGQLRALPRLHIRPINVMVCHGPMGRSGFEVGFPLRCFQRLSRPDIATRRCHWHDNRCTRGLFIPVLSY
jgi:hypothetical protein